MNTPLPSSPSCRTLPIFFLLSSVFLLSGCGGSLYRVKPAVELPPLKENARSVTAAGLMVRVAPLLTDEESQELFEANLPLSGVLPVRVELIHKSGTPVDLKGARFRLRESGEREWKLISTKQAVSQILKANDIFVYNPNSRKQFASELEAYGLDTKSPITAAEARREGFLFFRTPDGHAVQSPTGLTLLIERLAEPISLSIN